MPVKMVKDIRIVGEEAGFVVQMGRWLFYWG